MIFLSAGRKYNDTTVRNSNSNEAAISFTESPDAICEKYRSRHGKERALYNPIPLVLILLEAAIGIEPMNKGFAV